MQGASDARVWPCDDGWVRCEACALLCLGNRGKMGLWCWSDGGWRGWWIEMGAVQCSARQGSSSMRNGCLSRYGRKQGGFFRRWQRLGLRMDTWVCWKDGRLLGEGTHEWSHGLSDIKVNHHGSNNQPLSHVNNPEIDDQSFQVK
jgi:hypothetical protein